METPSGATTETTTAAPDGNASDSPGAESPPAAKDSGETKRIDELTRDFRETQRDRDYWRTKALEREAAERQQPRAEQREPAEVDEEIKTFADFKYDEKAYAKYQRDLARAEARRETAALRGELEGARTNEQRAAQKIEFADKAEAWAKVQKLEDVDKMFASPRDGGPAVSDTMAELMIESDQGPAILNYLTRNVAESRRIHSLSPTKQAKEIGRLEAKFASAPAGSTVSGAPPPPPQVRGASDTGAARKSPSEMTDAEWWAQKSRRAKK